MAYDWGNKLSEKIDKIKSIKTEDLESELHLLRGLVQSILDECNADDIAMSAVITKMNETVKNIANIVAQINKMKIATMRMVDYKTVESLLSRIAEIIANTFSSEPEKVDFITSKLSELLISIDSASQHQIIND